MSTYTINGIIGVDVTKAATTTAGYAVGTIVAQADGSQWRYVSIPTSTTIIQYACYAIASGGNTTGNVAALTSTIGLRGVSICIAQQAVTSDTSNVQYCWMLIANPEASTDYKVRVAASCAIDAKLATTAFGGTLDDTTAGTVLRIDGIVLTDSQPSGSSGSRTFRTSSFPLGWGAV